MERRKNSPVYRFGRRVSTSVGMLAVSSKNPRFRRPEQGARNPVSSPPPPLRLGRSPRRGALPAAGGCLARLAFPPPESAEESAKSGRCSSGWSDDRPLPDSAAPPRDSSGPHPLELAQLAPFEAATNRFAERPSHDAGSFDLEPDEPARRSRIAPRRIAASSRRTRRANQTGASQPHGAGSDRCAERGKFEAYARPDRRNECDFHTAEYRRCERRNPE